MVQNTPPMTGTPSVSTKLKQKMILEMRMQSPPVSFPDIAEHFGNTQGYIYKLYKKALKAIIVDEVEELRKIEMIKLEKLEAEAMRVLQAFHPYVNSGLIVRDVKEDENGNPIEDEDGNLIRIKLEDAGPKLAAIDRVVKLMERRSKLLGLDMPTKIAPTSPDGTRPAAVTIMATPLDEKI